MHLNFLIFLCRLLVPPQAQVWQTRMATIIATRETLASKTLDEQSAAQALGAPIAVVMILEVGNVFGNTVEEELWMAAFIGELGGAMA